MDDILSRVEAVLDEQVRPQLALHGGSVAVRSLEDGVLKVTLAGQCQGCPSAGITLEEVVAEAVKGAIPEITDVVLVSGVSDALWDMAKTLLKQRRGE
jgi:Fe-S cluster biogenesis protein NfuA